MSRLHRLASAVYIAALVAAVAGVVGVAVGGRIAAAVAGISSVVVSGLALSLARHAGPVPAVKDIVGRRADGPADDPAGDPADDAMLSDAALDAAVDGRLAAAKRALRPLSVVYFEAIDVSGDRAQHLSAAELDLGLRNTLRESDLVGRAAPGVHVFLLEDTGEDGAVWTAERLRRQLGDRGRPVRFRAGIASYPNHGLEASEIRGRALAALDTARDWDRDRIEVATSAP